MTILRAARLTASNINSFKNNQDKFTLLTGSGNPIPIVYGRASITGEVIVQ